MRLTSSLLVLLALLALLSSPGEAAELGWMKVDGYGNPTPADHQVNYWRSSSSPTLMFDVCRISVTRSTS